ncbi:hypothetical protein JOD55_000875 [Arcanobacterium pluranimalium]|uniref:cell division protein PerM n=1 Tax=Arcanobacterium pluranimalium TaxID=108028 RepID=UPI00195B54C6|nr:DUF6350 family protein [Arcanobacterium pluranimalium]MBM7825048.1 hypothetical protein [Arcanobacterium pluranimalium]
MQEKTIDLRSVFPVFRAVNQPLVFTWLGAMLCAVFFYAITASSPLLGNIAWSDAARFGTQWWLTSFGAQLEVGQGTLSLIPSLYTALIVFSAYFALRRIGIFAWADVAFSAVFAAVTIAIIGLASAAQGSWWIAIIGAALSFAVVAIWAGREELLMNLPWWPYLTRAWPILRVLLLATCLAALIVFLIGFVAGISNVRQINDSYFQNAIGTASMVLVQLMYLPTYLLWALAWVFGAGFSIGADTSFAIMGNTLGPLPAIPVFGALPSYGTGFAWLIALPILGYCLLGAVCMRVGWLNKQSLAPAVTDTSSVCTSELSSDDGVPAAQNPKRVPFGFFASDRGNLLVNALIAGSIFVFLCSLSALIASGSLGPGRMAVIGSRPALVAAYALLVGVLPFVFAAMLAHPDTIKELQSLAKASRRSPSSAAKKETNSSSIAPVTDVQPATESETDSPAVAPPTETQPATVPTTSAPVTNAPTTGTPATDMLARDIEQETVQETKQKLTASHSAPSSQNSEEKSANADTKPEKFSENS